MRRRVALLGLLVVQTLCTVVFVSDIAITVLGLRTVPIDWQLREFIEIGAAFGLILGLVLGVMALLRSDAQRKRAEDQVQVAAGALSELIAQRFDEWSLTPAERDVALYAVKGFTLAETAQLRGTSEGTIKAQSAAVYRKAGVANRTQLLSLFVEDLMDKVLLPDQAQTTTTTTAASLARSDLT